MKLSRRPCAVFGVSGLPGMNLLWISVHAQTLWLQHEVFGTLQLGSAKQASQFQI